MYEIDNSPPNTSGYLDLVAPAISTSIYPNRNIILTLPNTNTHIIGNNTSDELFNKSIGDMITLKDNCIIESIQNPQTTPYIKFKQGSNALSLFSPNLATYGNPNYSVTLPSVAGNIITDTSLTTEKAFGTTLGRDAEDILNLGTGGIEIGHNRGTTTNLDGYEINIGKLVESGGNAAASAAIMGASLINLQASQYENQNPIINIKAEAASVGDTLILQTGAEVNISAIKGGTGTQTANINMIASSEIIMNSNFKVNASGQITSLGGLNSDEYAKFTSTGLVGRTTTEVKSDLLLNNVENTALSTWTGSANITKLGGIAVLGTISTPLVTTSSLQSTLGLVSGSGDYIKYQAYSGTKPLEVYSPLSSSSPTTTYHMAFRHSGTGTEYPLLKQDTNFSLGFHWNGRGDRFTFSKNGELTCYADKVTGFDILDLSAPLIGNTNKVQMLLGKANSTKNNAKIGYYHDSDGSNSNYLQLGLNSLEDTIKITGSREVYVKDSLYAKHYRISETGGYFETYSDQLMYFGTVDNDGDTYFYYNNSLNKIISSGTWSSWSDSRLKTHVETGDAVEKEMEDYFDKIDINKYGYVEQFAGSKGTTTETRSFGFIAQQVQQVYSEGVGNAGTSVFPSERSTATNKIQLDDALTVDKEKVNILLWGKVKQMDKVIKQQQEQINLLLSKVNI